MSKEKAARTKQVLFQAYLAQSESSFMTFVGGLIVPASIGPILFAKHMAEHQRVCFEDIAPSLEALRLGAMPPKRRFWIERTKKAAKDSDAAAMILWLLAFPKRPLLIQIGAADRDQAAIIRKRIDDYLFYNPWLNEYVDTSAANRPKSKDGLVIVDIVAADVTGSHGTTPDFLVCNELTHVAKWEFIENLLDNADGVPRGMVLVCTNAGYRGTPADTLRKIAEESSHWTCHYFSEPAPWISEADLKDAKQRNSDSRFRRLWKGQWVSGHGDAFDEDLIERCIDGRRKALTRPEKGWIYVGGLDLGIAHDHAGLAILGVHREYPKVRLAFMRPFLPHPKTKEVNLMEVEDACLSMHRVFHLTWFGYDPYQAKLMAQRLKSKGVPMREVPFTGPRLNVMASTLMEVIREAKLEAYDDQDGRLKADFGRFNIVEKSYGYRLESTRDASGHADVGTALVIALPQAIALLEGKILMPMDDLIYDDGTELAPWEVDEMPEELREIHEQPAKHDSSEDRLMRFEY